MWYLNALCLRLMGRINYILPTWGETLMSFGTSIRSLLLVWISIEFVNPSLEEELCPLASKLGLLGVVIASLLAATTAVVLASTPPPAWCLFTVGLLFKLSVAVKDVTYIGEFFMKPFNSSLDVVVWFNCNKIDFLSKWLLSIFIPILLDLKIDLLGQEIV